MRDPAAQLSVLLRVAEEVDDLGQLCLRLVDPRHVGEGDAVPGGLITACARASERSQQVLRVAGAPQQPEQQQHEDNRRAESEQQVLPPRRAGIERLRIDDDLFLLEQPRERIVVGEGRNLRLETRSRLRLRVGLLLRERTLDRSPLGRDLLDVARAHLIEEEGAVRNAHARRRLGRTRAEVEIDTEQDEREHDPHATDARPGSLLRRRSAGRGWSARIFASVAALHEPSVARPASAPSLPWPHRKARPAVSARMATLEATAPAPAERERALALGAALVTVSLWASAFVGI